MENPLFTPLQVKTKTLRNRIVMPPMVVNRGIHTPEGWEWYARHARGGVGLVIVEAADSIRFGSEYTVENLAPLVEGIHQGGALAAIQIFPGWRGQKIQPAELSLAGVHTLLEQYQLAAEICLKAGFDGLEPHGAHGFLLNQFFSPLKNLRTDGYGGSLEKRMRLALEIIALLQPLVAKAGALLLYRHSPVREGYGIPESLELGQALVQGGVDILDISPASKEAPGDRSAPFMGLGVPVIAVNELDRPERALEALREKRADLVAVGRGLIADPDWTLKVQEDRLDEIIICQYCDDCFACLDRGEAVVCSEWKN
jgi:2,4-dienoyl-CoA reductase-like NADH-dependent reductase (Old Yellow Enzyme family)